MLKTTGLAWGNELKGIDPRGCVLAKSWASVVSTGRASASSSCALFGTLVGLNGTVEIGGQRVRLSSPRQAEVSPRSAWR